MIKIFDSHCHLSFEKYDADREAVIERAREAGVGIINVGDNKKESQKVVELAHKYPEMMWATVGCHPNETGDFDYDYLKNLAQDEKVVAIGECGLDYYFARNGVEQADDYTDRKKIQAEVFEMHIRLARETEKPLMIHCREAFLDLLEILNRHKEDLGKKPGVVHFFTGNKEDAESLLSLGFCFTFGGLITFNREFDEIIRFLSLDKILLETDAPFVAPEPYRGQRNEPAFVREVSMALAKIKGISTEEAESATTNNVRSVFGI